VTYKNTSSGDSLFATESASGGPSDGTYNTSTVSNHTHTVTITAQNTSNSTTGGVETRPVNLCVNFIIKC